MTTQFYEGSIYIIPMIRYNQRLAYPSLTVTVFYLKKFRVRIFNFSNLCSKAQEKKLKLDYSITKRFRYQTEKSDRKSVV